VNEETEGGRKERKKEIMNERKGDETERSNVTILCYKPTRQKDAKNHLDADSHGSRL
jgi:hypothetical protein